MTPEQEAFDLMREVLTLAKQGRSYKRALKKLQALAQNDLQAKEIYCMLMESINLEKK